ncbi:MAG: GH13_16 / GH13_36 / GH13_17 / GH13_4 / GH 13 / GH13_35 / GH13_23 / GH13_31 / GH13_40 / GH13 _30 / GH13_29, partial [uncultured Phycisphaerae bacterium]
REGVIFPGKQHTTWSYDRLAKRWYMHRFYPHQPDLNINNPRVRDEIHKVIGFWLELGLSGFRVDAVPFLIEQVGRHNPATRDPHDYLRDLRSFMTRRRGDAMLLAEANEPAKKLAKFFGDRGNQMHMLFNFLLNQALHLSLVRGDATPAVKTLRSLPEVPAASQWANFVKNHDEATFDKLTDKEREEIFAAFAPRKSMRLYDRGIRRRFPSMVGGDRRRMELMYSLLFSLPGTPVLFYGEEIGMGDDQRAEDRIAVRLPMQWSADDCGGFTTADEKDAPRKPLREGPFGYPRVNVRAQREDPASFLSWTGRAIRTRKEWPEFGWGAWRLLATRSREALAHVVTWDGGSAMAVHNFADRPVRATIRLPADLRGGTSWRHLFGAPADDSEPPAGPADGRLVIELPPYGYHWF